jgi:molybdate transport system substrate-binding protein
MDAFRLPIRKDLYLLNSAFVSGVIAIHINTISSDKNRDRGWLKLRRVPALEQGAVIVKSSKQREIAKQFLEFIKGPQGQEIMKRYGFTLPG